MNEADWRSVASKIVGVIDLRGGLPVHATGGDRTRYRSVGVGDGSVGALLDHYRQFAIKRFYLADLNSIEGLTRQWTNLTAVWSHLRDDESIWIDAGWRAGEPTESLVSFLENPRCVWIVASETCRHAGEALRLASQIDPRRLAIGLDFRDGVFLGSGTPSPWIETACRAGIRDGLILEFGDIGSASGRGGVSGLQKLTAMRPGWTWLSGGGVGRPRDLNRFVSAGCDGVLVATALLPVG